MFKVIALASALILAATGCGGSSPAKTEDPSKLDDSARLACDDFANGYKAALTPADRADLARKVNKWAQQSRTSRIAPMGAALSRGAGSDAGWKIAGDAYAQACLDAGWKAR